MADAGQVVNVLAGRAAAVAKARPYTEGVTGKAVIEFADEPPRKALQLKLIGNVAVLNMVESLAETHALAEKIGLGGEQIHRFYENMLPGPYVAYSTRMLNGDYYARDVPLFAVDLARKDAHGKLWPRLQYPLPYGFCEITARSRVRWVRVSAGRCSEMGFGRP